ncbi:MAG: hypothetical protein AAF333_00215 [Planctomycetota bacterium]
MACAALRPVSTGASSSSANRARRLTAWTRMRDNASSAWMSASIRTPATARRVPSDDAQRAMSAGVMSSDRAVAATSSTPASITSSSFSSSG